MGQTIARWLGACALAARFRKVIWFVMESHICFLFLSRSLVPFLTFLFLRVVFGLIIFDVILHMIYALSSFFPFI